METLSASGMRCLCRSARHTFATARSSHAKKIHTQGNGLFGALGQGPTLMDSAHFEMTSQPDSESGEHRIIAKQVSTGWGHSGAVTVDGELMIWGRRNDFANLNSLYRIKGICAPLARVCCILGSFENEVHTTPKLFDGLGKVSSVHCSAGLTGNQISFT
jgi:alpha-tubulin suppressor-like RCC1 family protein